MNSFEILPGDAESTVILHVPHSSTVIPADVREGIVLSNDELAAELAAITDTHTDVIAIGAANRAHVRPWRFVNRMSRLVIDPERFPDEREELNAVGMGAVYEKTSDLQTLRTPTADERDSLIARFFEPYAAAMAQLVRERLAAVGKVTIIDVHSFPNKAKRYELHKSDARPELCIGADDFHTPEDLVTATREAMSSALFTGEIEVNQPFAGCYVPLDQYGSNRAVEAVMLEIRRDVVAANMSELQAATAALVDTVQ